MKKLFIFIIFLISNIILSAQTIEWAKTFGETLYNYGKDIALDKKGNVFTVGFYIGTVDFDPSSNVNNLTSVGDGAYFITKFDNSGNFIWAKSIEIYELNSIALDKNGNLYITGGFGGTVDFDLSSNIYNLTSSNSIDAFVGKYDNDGNFKWVKRIGGTGIDKGMSIIIDENFNAITLGHFEGVVDFNPSSYVFNLTSYGYRDVFISKLDSLGNFIWAKQFGGPEGDGGSSIEIDSNSNIYFLGSFYNEIDLNPSQTEIFKMTSNTLAGFICKIDLNGNFIWASKISATGAIYLNSITVDLNNNLFAIGEFQGTFKYFNGTDTINYNASGSEDIFITKYDSIGNQLWVKQIGGKGVTGIKQDNGYAITSDNEGNIYSVGAFIDFVDFDPDSTSFTLYSGSDFYLDIFILKLNNNGEFIWACNYSGDYHEKCYSLAIDNNQNIFTTGYVMMGITDFDPSEDIYKLNTKTGYSVFISKLKQRGIKGYVYNDLNQKCYKDSNDMGIQHRIISINPGNIITRTNDAGVWIIDSLPVGTYTALVDTSGNWDSDCNFSQTFSVQNPNKITQVNDFALTSSKPCANPDISIFMPRMRPCFSNQKIYINACNQNSASGIINNAYVDVQLDNLISIQTASLAYSNLGNNKYRFQVGNLNIGQCFDFNIYCQVSCDAMLGQTLCLEANLYPSDSCVFDTTPSPFPINFTPCNLPWDKSSLKVKGKCQNDSVIFTITNVGEFGNGNMDCFSPVRIYIDGEYSMMDSVKLVGGNSKIFAFEADGRTWRLEADQHPLHPGNSHPNATVEACGNLNNWKVNMVNIFPPDDADPVVDIYCGVVTGSFDPNDKTGYPLGVKEEHFIMPNQQLQYIIRFQNTGTDTAFTVVIRDTLDTDLDIFSVVSGVASNDYNFIMYGPRVLEWTFNNILLPDSTTDESGSHGFITFTVNQNSNLPNDTKITNSAGIYFDFNAPVITNQTFHTVNDMLKTNIVLNSNSTESKNFHILIYPNPTKDEVFVEIENGIVYKVYSVDGKAVLSGKLENNKTRISTKDLENGVYFIEIYNEFGKIVSKLLISK